MPKKNEKSNFELSAITAKYCNNPKAKHNRAHRKGTRVPKQWNGWGIAAKQPPIRFIKKYCAISPFATASKQQQQQPQHQHILQFNDIKGRLAAWWWWWGGGYLENPEDHWHFGGQGVLRVAEVEKQQQQPDAACAHYIRFFSTGYPQNPPQKPKPENNCATRDQPKCSNQKMGIIFWAEKANERKKRNIKTNENLHHLHISCCQDAIQEEQPEQHTRKTLVHTFSTIKTNSKSTLLIFFSSISHFDEWWPPSQATPSFDHPRCNE